MPSWDDDRDWLLFEREEGRDEPANWIGVLAIFAMLAIIVAIVAFGLSS